MLDAVNLVITHGYMLSGSGSNVYVQNLCRALVRTGYDVHLLCQDGNPLAYDFVGGSYTAGKGGIEQRGAQETPYAGRCNVYRPQIGDLLPVYVYDDYPGWRVKTFLELTDPELDDYVTLNVAALRSVLDVVDPIEHTSLITNHSVPNPLIARRALRDTDVSYASVVHGSCLQYVARRSTRYMEAAREGLAGARSVIALSGHSTETIREDFPELADRTHTLPGGVDTDLFHPGALALRHLECLRGGPGRGPAQEGALGELLARGPGTAAALAGGLREVSSTYEPRAHDADAGDRLRDFLSAGASGPLVVYVGKLIHSKGVHSLLSAFARVRAVSDARLLVVGFGTFREALQALTLALGSGDRHTTGLLAGSGRLFEGGEEGPMEHFHATEELFESARGLEDAVQFTGPLQHEELARLLPAADAAVVPSIFPETFGLVAAEFAASGVPPFVADHSGLREAGATVGRDLPFDVRVPLDGFEENLARALTVYLGMPGEARQRCRETVRRNSVEYLSWDTLAGSIAGLSLEGR